MLYTNIGTTTFTLLSSRSGLNDPKIDIPEMEVTFENGQKDTLVLRHYNAIPDSTNIDHTRLCNYLGYLKYEEDARVAVTGCVDERNLEGKMNITLLSKRSPYQKSFFMDWEDKKFGDTYFREDLSDYQDKITFKMEINQNKIV